MGLKWLFVTLVVLRLAAVPFSAEEVALAQIIEGEANCEFLHGDAAGAYAVGWVARNRLEAGRWGESYQDLRGFNGRLNRDPEWRYMAIARLVINADEDPTEGALYALSAQDVERLECRIEEASFVVAPSEQRALFFYREWVCEEGQ